MKEYGIKHIRDDELHRGPMTEAEANHWIADWLADGGRLSVFYVVSREVTDWEKDTP